MIEIHVLVIVIKKLYLFIESKQLKIYLQLDVMQLFFNIKYYKLLLPLTL